jgi:hypothetical protein
VLELVRPLLPIGFVAVACAWWLVAAPRMWGGRGAGSVAVGAIVTGLAILAVQPHRHLPGRVIGGALAVSAGAIAVATTSPTGWAGATTAASYVCAAWMVVVVAAGVARDRRLVNVVLALVAIGVLVEIAESWLAWWGGETASAPMIGTFFWHDPFAAFLIPGSLIGLSLWLRRTGSLAALGLAATALGSVGLVYSTSRAADACYAVGVVIVLAANLLVGRAAAARRVAIAVFVSAAAVFGIAGPPFFPHRVLPFAGTAARASGQSLGQNGGYRIDFWREAVGVFGRHPVTGGGYHSLASAAAGHVPAGWPLSPLAHNGYLQALSDGGLLLAVPFLIGVLAICWWVLSSLSRAIRRRDVSTLALAVPVSLGVMLVHSAVDFDWSYAADFVLVAILGGLVLGLRRSDVAERTAPGRHVSRVVAAAVLAGVALTGVAAVSARGGDLRQSLPISSAGGAR